jgi:hypothetical protein
MYRRHAARAMVGALTTVTMAACLAPGIASADGGGPGSRTILIGPIRAAHGFEVTITGSACSTKHASVTVDYTRGTAKAMLSHSYGDAKAKGVCAATRSLRSGSLRARWGSMLRVEVRVVDAARRTTAPARLPNCRQRGGLTRSALVAGTIAADIHSRVFGRIHVRRARVELLRAGTVHCAPPRGGLNLQLVSGSRAPAPSVSNTTSLFATQPARGKRSVTISAGQDNPGGGITGSLFASFEGGPSLFTANSNLSSAHVGAMRPLLSGGLLFHGLPACPGSANAVNGTVSGRLVLHDPVLGSVTLDTTHLLFASLTKGSASPGQCNGPGAVAPQVHFADSSGCGSPGVCTISGHSNTVTFQDESSPGSASITSESWNFGDGSAAVPGTLDGQVQHIYAAAGTYTVTLTLTSSTGQTYTSTGTVYIGS